MRRKRRLSIQSALFLLLCVVLIPVLLIQCYIYYDRYQTRRTEELRANLEVARAVAKTFETFVQDVLHLEAAVGLALTPSQPLSPEERNRILAMSRAEYPVIWNLAWLSPAGSIAAASVPEAIGTDLSDRVHIQKVIAGQEWAVSDLVLTKTTMEPVFTIARGVRDERRELLGIVIAGVLPDKLEEALKVERFEGGGFTLVDSQGMLVYRNPVTNLAWEKRNLLVQFPEFREALKGNETTATVYVPFEGKNRLAGFTPVPLIGWAAAAGRTEEIAMAAINSKLLPEAMMLLLVTLSAFGIALVLSRSVSAPVKRLRDHALALGLGGVMSPAKVSGPTEIKDLADAFNTMAGEVRSRESALRASEALYRTIGDTIDYGVWVCDAEWRCTYVSESFLELVGMTREQCSGDGWAGVLHPDDAGRAVAEWHECVRTGTPWHFVLRFLGVDGQYHPILSHRVPVKSDGGEVIAWAGINLDISDLKQAEQALRESEERFRTVADFTYDWEYWLGIDGKPVYVSPSCERMTGYSVEEFMKNPKLFTEIILPSDRTGMESHLKDGFESDLPASLDLRIAKRGGEQRWINHVCRSVWSADGRWLGRRASNRDITERKRTEDELRRSYDEMESRVGERTAELVEANESIREQSRELDAFFEHAMGKVVFLDRDFNFIRVNDAYAKACARPVEDFPGRNHFELYPHAENESIFREVVKTGRAYQAIAKPFSFPDHPEWGVTYWDWTLVPILDDSGEPDFLVFSLNDVTERKKAEEQIKSYMAKLKESNQALQDFASMASHDLQEPLRKVISFGNLLRQKYGSSLAQEGEDYLDRMLNATGRMQGLLDALLRYSRVTTKREPFGEVNLTKTVKEVVLDLETRIEQAGGEVEIGDLPTVEADPDQMRQLFQNLIGNGLKYHKEEKPMVRVYGETLDLGCRIFVEDNGIGFDEAHLDAIFKPFQRLHGKSSRYEGTGMGLAICRKIVERHGGSITARSMPGKGTMFVVSLPSKHGHTGR